MPTTSYSIDIIHVHTVSICSKICVFASKHPMVFPESLYEASPGKSGLACAPFT